MNDLVYLVNERGEYLRVRPGFYLFEKPTEEGLGNAYYAFERVIALTLFNKGFSDCHMVDVHIEELEIDPEWSFLRPTA